MAMEEDMGLNNSSPPNFKESSSEHHSNSIRRPSPGNAPPVHYRTFREPYFFTIAVQLSTMMIGAEGSEYE
jgi:hypothetical protein